VRALALVDGEHYPDVVRDALAAVPYDVVGAVFLGGGEKLRGEPDYGVPLFGDLAQALAEAGAEVVLDLSDEPVVDPTRRFRLASQALAAGLSYAGADFRFQPVELAPFELPALAVIGSGKRVGKTAVTGRAARLLSRSRDVVVVAMGRGGPPDPVVSAASPTPGDLLALSRAGLHAASDYLEDAALAGVTTIGARRCGGGLAGQPFVSNVAEAARLAASLEPELVLFEGSGAAIPPVAVSGRILVAGAHQDAASVAGYLGAYRLLLSDLVVLTMCEEPLTSPAHVAALRSAVAEVAPGLPVVATVMRPRPAEPLTGRRVAFFSTAPAAVHPRLRTELEAGGADVVLVSGNLSRRDALRSDLASPEAQEADTYLVEIKAAAIDVVAEAAAERGASVVFADNDVVPLPGEPDLDEHVLALAEAAVGAGVAA
jgi:cyclic 2,3-diphosphoglycerate synthase